MTGSGGSAAPASTTTTTSSNAANDSAKASKPKRVRTGCLTCRERHLKCDEEMPICQNCQKSNRTCKRGVRLNFIDMNVKRPPVFAATEEWSVQFLDESREIASEYRGGLAKYGGMRAEDETVSRQEQAQQVQQAVQQQQQQDVMFDFNMSQVPPAAPTPQHQSLPGLPQSTAPYGANNHQPFVFEDQGAQQQIPMHHHQHTHSQSEAASVASYGGAGMVGVGVGETQTAPGVGGDIGIMTDPDETFYMQVFVEEVGCWMDSMDPQKHFSRLLPFHALTNPMLHHAFLACGARHMFLVNPTHTKEEKGLAYYNASTSDLLKALQNPNRDIVICATTAVILNVYELMGERAMQRMNHIAGCRALIKECRWSARATGVGASCFWLNVGMEVLSCLHFNWQVAWDPDDWGVNMDFSPEQEHGREELWTHRMLYIIGKICNFRAQAPRKQDPDPSTEAYRTQKRYEDWKHLKSLADLWDQRIPRTMQPMAHVYPWQTRVRSAFPEVWLIKRTTVVARLFYHTAMVLLSQLNPYESVAVPGEMQELQRHHAVMICGIVRHTKDRGIASVALRSIHVAGETLTDRREQDEVFSTIKQITENTGWNVRFMFEELPQKWGWASSSTAKATASPSSQSQQSHGSNSLHAHSNSTSSIAPGGGNAGLQPFGGAQTTPKQARPRLPSGIVNPMYAHADFSQPKHPYETHYVPPNPMLPQVHYGFSGGFG